MKNTLLALMLVSSLFVISCGADSTKPQDAYKSQTTETKTGTKTLNNVTVSSSIVKDFVTTPGEKVTEIVQVTTTKGTNTVSAITKNADGGIYQFTISDASAVNATVTYKYIMREAAPMVEKEITGTYSSGGSLTIVINNSNFIFNKSIVSVTDKNGKQLTSYSTDLVNNNTVTINGLSGYIAGDTFTVRYTYRDITKMSEKPITEATTAPQISGTTATIKLDAAAYAGRSYYLVATIKENSTVNIDYIEENKIVSSTGTITITAPTGGTGTPWTKIDTCTYKLWVY